ncbi:MAG: proline dehydrogenase [Bacteroidetes bacterium]|nr:proline dehydrogenase [Bacteroidota bacterium]
MSKISFDNTEIAFRHKSNRDLRNAKFLFAMFNWKWLIKIGPPLSVFALKIGLPVKGLIKGTIFKQFCGGENIAECIRTAEGFKETGMGFILDYSVEGADNEEGYDANVAEIKKTIDASKGRTEFPFAVFKTTGIARFELLEKVHAGGKLTETETNEWNRVKARFTTLCDYAVINDVRLFVDAEDSWIQDPIDNLTVEMMQKHNRGEVRIYNTLQMYRKDRLSYLKNQIRLAEEGNYMLGFKLVRGAYMEKERARAQEKNYDDPIQKVKEDTHRDYDEALRVCFQNKDRVWICAATHNETSSALLVELMEQNEIDPKDERFYFAQLFGMSDNISFNLSQGGYQVAKYLPYGPVIAVMPYLGRRATENSSVDKQAGREITLVKKEIERRASLN